MNKQLYHLIEKSIEQLATDELNNCEVIGWASPVITFGDPSNCSIATLGLNPSNKEFVNDEGNELSLKDQRFPTLRSLKIPCWSKATDQCVHQIYDACTNYFTRNPYDSWFKSLDKIISGTKSSYYHPLFEACHLDLTPFATSRKWSELSPHQRNELIEKTGHCLGGVLKHSDIKLLVLNGQGVVSSLLDASDLKLARTKTRHWTLPRKSGKDVPGFAYEGKLTKFRGVQLDREISVLGYNHNIQSSFGVTTKIRDSIRDWISGRSMELAL